eukprot:TRINITY_DN79_c0_g2_i1.p1 TRINITY_DN79_c0_g2~~TRINITY_DN79_c0_g2_i1.p1  ORF type:complete len:259 (-),score=39.24 TRINITY_DN79_c0_g2_i1:74-850(-)
MTLIDMTMRPVSYLACMKCNADLSKKGTKACSGCHSVFYDDVVCQKNDWPIHKTECKAQQRQVISIVRARFPEVDTMPKLLARPDACGIIAKSYKYGEDGLEKNAGLSVFWTMQWVKGGYPEAMEALGLIYTNGSGVSKNESKGTELLLKAANLGHASAQYEIGRTYVFKYDNPEAAKWFRKAAEGGHAEAAFFLAHCFKSGDGLGKDLAEAAVWYRKSADLGYVEAECEIGRCYERGLGVEKDLVEEIGRASCRERV